MRHINDISLLCQWVVFAKKQLKFKVFGVKKGNVQ